MVPDFSQVQMVFGMDRSNDFGVQLAPPSPQIHSQILAGTSPLVASPLVTPCSAAAAAAAATSTAGHVGTCYSNGGVQTGAAAYKRRSKLASSHTRKSKSNVRSSEGTGSRHCGRSVGMDNLMCKAAGKSSNREQTEEPGVYLLKRTGNFNVQLSAGTGQLLQLGTYPDKQAAVARANTGRAFTATLKAVGEGKTLRRPYPTDRVELPHLTATSAYHLRCWAGALGVEVVPDGPLHVAAPQGRSCTCKYTAVLQDGCLKFHEALSESNNCSVHGH